MDNVVILPVVTSLKIPAERVLNSALKADMQDVVIIGYDADGKFYFASSESGSNVLWLIEKAKKQLLE